MWALLRRAAKACRRLPHCPQLAAAQVPAHSSIFAEARALQRSPSIVVARVSAIASIAAVSRSCAWSCNSCASCSADYSDSNPLCPITGFPCEGFWTILNSIYAREAEAMCDHVWIFEARTLSTQPVRRRCGMCGVYRMEPRCREPGTSTCKLRAGGQAA